MIVLIFAMEDVDTGACFLVTNENTTRLIMQTDKIKGRRFFFIITNSLG
jgi:hypothetical protein